jgi:hypothetical protein
VLVLVERRRDLAADLGDLVQPDTVVGVDDDLDQLPPAGLLDLERIEVETRGGDGFGHYRLKPAGEFSWHVGLS